MSKALPDAIQASLHDSRRWHDSAGREGAPARWADEVLDGADLAEASLCEALLVNVSFKGANLAIADLAYAHAGGCCFDGVFARGALFAKSNLTESTFRDADLDDTRFAKAILTRANLDRARLVGASLDGASCIEASLRAAKLTGTTLKGTCLWDCNLEGADLAGAHFDRTELSTRVLLSGATGLERAIVHSIRAGRESPTLLEGDAAREWLLRRASGADR